jgi:hypothetical protein
MCTIHQPRYLTKVMMGMETVVSHHDYTTSSLSTTARSRKAPSVSDIRITRTLTHPDPPARTRRTEEGLSSPSLPAGGRLIRESRRQRKNTSNIRACSPGSAHRLLHGRAASTNGITARRPCRDHNVPSYSTLLHHEQGLLHVGVAVHASDRPGRRARSRLPT